MKSQSEPLFPDPFPFDQVDENQFEGTFGGQGLGSEEATTEGDEDQDGHLGAVRDQFIQLVKGATTANSDLQQTLSTLK